MEIDYGRLNALEAALGGRAAINEAFVNGRSLAARVLEFPFAFDTPGLTDGVVVYRPKVNDLLLNAWVEIGRAWDGTTPHADIGTFAGSEYGAFGNIIANTPIDLSVAAEDSGGMRVQYANGVSVASLYVGGAPRFISGDPLKLVVSQNGQSGGVDPGATHDEAILYLVLA